MYLKDIFGFAEACEKATYGFGYQLILARNNDNAVLNEDNAVINAKSEFNSIEWYVPPFTPSISRQTK